MTASIIIEGITRDTAVEVLNSCGFRVEHRNHPRGYWSNSKIFNGDDEKVGNITPATGQLPLRITLVMPLLSREEIIAVGDFINNRLAPAENKGD